MITYKDMWRVENSIVVKFAFTDGDGDLGLKDEEIYYPFGPCDPNYHNLIIDPYQMVDGNFVLARKIVVSECSSDTMVLWDTVGYDQRIKYLIPEGKDKTLEGDIEVTLNEAYVEFPNDTIRFRLTLFDRALNKSNEIETDAVITF